MPKARPYENEILQTVRGMPSEALPRVLELITVVREEFRAVEKRHGSLPTTSHERTRDLAASSKTNWAQTLVTEREVNL